MKRKLIRELIKTIIALSLYKANDRVVVSQPVLQINPTTHLLSEGRKRNNKERIKAILIFIKYQ